MKYPNFFVVMVLLMAVIAVLGCTGSQTVSNDQPQSSGTPAATQAPAPQTDTVGFSRKTPAPIGTPVVDDFEITEHNSKTGKYSYIKAQEKITILEVKRGYDAIKPLFSADDQKYVDKYRMDEKYKGYEPLLIKVRYELVSLDKDLNDPWQRTYWDFGLVAGDGTVYADPGGITGGLLTFIDSKKFWFETYAPSSMEGYMLGFVRTDDPNPLLKDTKHYDSPLWFKTA